MDSPHSSWIIKKEHQGKYPEGFLKLTPDTVSGAYPNYIEYEDGRRIMLPDNLLHAIIPQIKAFAHRNLLGQENIHRKTYPYFRNDMSTRRPKANPENNRI